MFDDVPSTPSSSGPKKDFNFSQLSSKLPMILGVVVIVIALGASGFFFIKYQSEKTRAQQLLGASTETPEQAKQLIDTVGKLIELPNEEPTIATVSDKEKLSGQPFFAKSQNGDKVLVYSKAKVAVIYRPSTGKIVNYATNVTIGGQAAATPAPTGGEEISETPSISPTEEPTVAPTTAPVISSPTTEPTVVPIQ